MQEHYQQKPRQPSEPSFPITGSHGYTNTTERQDWDLKSHLMMFIESFKKDINNFLKEIQERFIRSEKKPKYTCVVELEMKDVNTFRRFVIIPDNWLLF